MLECLAPGLVAVAEDLDIDLGYGRLPAPVDGCVDAAFRGQVVPHLRGGEKRRKSVDTLLGLGEVPEPRHPRIAGQGQAAADQRHRCCPQNRSYRRFLHRPHHITPARKRLNHGRERNMGSESVRKGRKGRPALFSTERIGFAAQA